MGELFDNQTRFTGMVYQLLGKAWELGYQVTFGETYRAPEQAALMAKQGKGIAHSLHTDRLAIDINLFKDGVYLTDAASHRPLGEWFESIGGTWGGRFGDPNHYSLSYGGRK